MFGKMSRIDFPGFSSIMSCTLLINSGSNVGLNLSVLHPIVWVRYEDGKRWPAKLMAELPNSQLLVSFFGTYVTRKAQTKCVSLHTRLAVSVNASANDSALGGFGIRRMVNAGESKDEGTFNRALEQLGHHVELLSQAFPKFKFPSAPATRILPFSRQSLAKYYKSLNQWIPVSENHELLSNSEPELQNNGQGSTVTATGSSDVGLSTLSPGPNGDDADSAQTVEQPCLPSSPSLPPSLLSVTPPPSHSPKSATCTTITTTTTTTASDNHNTEDLVEPLLMRLSSNFATSLPLPTTGVTTSNRPPLMSTAAVPTSENGGSVQPLPSPKETPRSTDVSCREVDANVAMSVDHQTMDETADTPDTETFPPSDSTVSTLPLRLSEGLGQSDLRTSLVTHFQEARDSFSRSLQSLLDGFFQNLEESVNDAAVSWSRGPSATVSEPDLTLPSRSHISTRNSEDMLGSQFLLLAKEKIRSPNLERPFQGHIGDRSSIKQARNLAGPTDCKQFKMRAKRGPNKEEHLLVQEIYSSYPLLTDQSTQTPRCVVVSTQFLQRNRLEKTLLKAEVLRLTQELERARLEKEYTRLEIATNQHDHLSELRAVWEAETHAIVDGVVEICEQDANKKIQEVKKKQWVGLALYSTVVDVLLVAVFSVDAHRKKRLE
ncbi:hypothetical protein ACTXT7_011528 [Hymenolepis weldensis]